MPWYYVSAKGILKGPMSFGALVRLFIEKEVTSASPLWNGCDVTHWTALDCLPDLLHEMKTLREMILSRLPQSSRTSPCAAHTRKPPSLPPPPPPRHSPHHLIGSHLSAMAADALMRKALCFGRWQSHEMVATKGTLPPSARGRPTHARTRTAPARELPSLPFPLKMRKMKPTAKLKPKGLYKTMSLKVPALGPLPIGRAVVRKTSLRSDTPIPTCRGLARFKRGTEAATKRETGASAKATSVLQSTTSSYTSEMMSAIEEGASDWQSDKTRIMVGEDSEGSEDSESSEYCDESEDPASEFSTSLSPSASLFFTKSDSVFDSRLRNISTATVSVEIKTPRQTRDDGLSVISKMVFEAQFKEA